MTAPTNTAYVEADHSVATAHVPSIVGDMHRAHLARLQRIRVAAVGQKAKAAAEIDRKFVAVLEKSLEVQQEVLPAPKGIWFSILEESQIEPTRPPLVESIQRVACQYFAVSRNDMLSPRRDQRVAYPRHVAMYLAKTLTQRSMPEIGRRFGGRDHTTALHAVRKIEVLIRSDWTVAYDVAHVEAML